MPNEDVETVRIKRIRQACLICRKKKVRCSGEKPECAACVRAGKRCDYEDADDGLFNPPSKTATVFVSTANENTQDEFITRFERLESRMIKLEKLMQDVASVLLDQRVTQSNRKRTRSASVESIPERPHSKPTAPEGTISNNPCPTTEVLLAATDVYFKFFHNQPYSLFHEASFRDKVKKGMVPQALAFAFLAITKRFPAGLHGTFDAKMVSFYAKRSWDSIPLPWTNSNLDYHVALSTIQAVHLLCIVDYTNGECSTAWIKLGLAIRVAQHIRLGMEPDGTLSSTQQEEHRRVFWSLYTLDKLISCGRGRAPSILAEDCLLRLPMTETAFRDGLKSDSPRVDQLGLDIQLHSAAADISPLAVVVLMSCILNKVTQYSLQEHRLSDSLSPWNSESQFSYITSLLLQVESDFDFAEPIVNHIRRDCMLDNIVDQQMSGPLSFARFLFHLCYCILHHPFLLQQRLRKLNKKAPAFFLTRSKESCRLHAEAISRMSVEVESAGCSALSSFYSYCHMIAGSIHSLFLKVDDAAKQHYDLSLDCLKRLSKYWPSAALMAAKLESLQRTSSSSAGPVDFSEQDQTCEVEKTTLDNMDYSELSMSVSMANASKSPEVSSSQSQDLNVDSDLGFGFFDYPTSGAEFPLGGFGSLQDVGRLISINDFGATDIMSYFPVTHPD